MRIAAVLATATIGSAALLAADNDYTDATLEDMYRKFHRQFVEDRMFAVRPRRRETPLRSVGPSAAEVEQMQGAAAQVVPKTVIYIGPVVNGCPCENGPKCSAEVWVYGYQPGRIEGLLLSKIEDTWTIGTVQKWWLQLDKISPNRDYAKYQEFKETFPACETEVRKIFEKRFHLETPKKDGTTPNNLLDRPGPR